MQEVWWNGRVHYFLKLYLNTLIFKPLTLRGAQALDMYYMVIRRLFYQITPYKFHRPILLKLIQKATSRFLISSFHTPYMKLSHITIIHSKQDYVHPNWSVTMLEDTPKYQISGCCGYRTILPVLRVPHLNLGYSDSGSHGFTLLLSGKRRHSNCQHATRYAFSNKDVELFPSN